MRVGSTWLLPTAGSPRDRVSLAAAGQFGGHKSQFGEGPHFNQDFPSAWRLLEQACPTGHLSAFNVGLFVFFWIGESPWPSLLAQK